LPATPRLLRAWSKGSGGGNNLTNPPQLHSEKESLTSGKKVGGETKRSVNVTPTFNRRLIQDKAEGRKEDHGKGGKDIRALRVRHQDCWFAPNFSRRGQLSNPVTEREERRGVR